ncbi:L-fucose permease [Rhizoctonia solani AG-1 IB]|uniref:L-fucose permease n=1 Tax=Thanatephorus cucumeris (strain AG1-IB / isolate 7/3/14) TaxID=1108050 RepID=M5C346_THACB|nr:L-fucose permease [Rhizoctonia solani AG-1 IB]
MPGGAVLTPTDGRKLTLREKLPPKNVVYPFALVTSLFFLWGFAYGLLDVLNKHFQNILHISKLESTGLQVAYFGLGYFCFSPIAGEILRRKSYKFTILMGLALYSTGAIFFWPCAKFASEDNKKAVFAGFVVCTGVIACGLASLETAANSYITCLPGTEPSGAAFRLQLSQSFNGIAAFSGPFIASKYFFSGENVNNLTNVQWVYLAVALLGVSIALLFGFTRLPETSEAELEAAAQAAAELSGVNSKTDDSIFQQPRIWFGWIAQFVYVGAQVTIASFFINYGAEAVGFSDAKSSNFLSYSLIMFTCGRFLGVIVLTVWPGELLVGIWATLCMVFVTCATFVHGKGGMACLMLTMFFEGPLFPCIFVMSTKNMGRHTRRASSLLISAISGGAVFPPIQGAIADKHGTRISFALCIPAFAYTAAYGYWLWVRHGAHFNLRHEKTAEVEPALEAMGGRTSLDLHPREKGEFDGSLGSRIQDVREDELKEKV